MITSTYSGGLIWSKCMLNPWANWRAFPGFMARLTSSSQTVGWAMSGINMRTMSPLLAASRVVMGSHPSSNALLQLGPPSLRPRTTLTPLSLMFKAWALPWLP